MEKISLIHPIYLDVPMLVSFLAALEGGIAFDKTVSRNTSERDAREASLSGGFKGLLDVLGVSLNGGVGEHRSVENTSQEAESRSHTEASLAIILYNKLKKEDGHIKSLAKASDFVDVQPGDLVEVSGVLQKNAVDSFIDYLSAVIILREIGVSRTVSEVNSSEIKNRPSKNGEKVIDKSEGLKKMQRAICEDRDRTPISNAVMSCAGADVINAVITLRRENLRDLTLSELHKNGVKVIGKVTRVVEENEKMISFENSGMAMVRPEILTELFSSISNQEGSVRVSFTDIEVNGPAIQILPLMIFV